MYGPIEDCGGAASLNPQTAPEPRPVLKRAAPPHPSRLVTEAEFAGVYAACAFAARFGLHLDTSVTISWRLMGREADTAVQAGSTALTKCLRDWFAERNLPCAFVYSHEIGERIGLHTHLLIYIPGEFIPDGARSKASRGESLRRQFRRYMQKWSCRHAGRPVPHAVRVRGPSVETPWLTWVLMNYIVKGYDRSAVVQSGLHSPDGENVWLGDLIAWPWQDPGPVTLAKRVGVSRSLGPDRRAAGVPGGLEHLYPSTAPAMVGKDFSVSGPAPGDPFSQPHAHGLQVPLCDRLAAFSCPHRPPVAFRSAYEDGARDVRRLYPTEFYQRVRLSARQHAAPATASADPNALDALLDALQLP